MVVPDTMEGILVRMEGILAIVSGYDDMIRTARSEVSET